MDYLGAHMSISGGIYMAPGRGRAAGCSVIQVFTQNSNQWRGKMPTDSDVALFALENERPELRTSGLATKLRILRDRLAEDGVGCAVWVSIPAGASFALSMGLAPVQVFWALRFHPLSAPFSLLLKKGGRVDNTLNYMSSSD